MRAVWSHLADTIAGVLHTMTLEQLCAPELVEIQPRREKSPAKGAGLAS